MYYSHAMKLTGRECWIFDMDGTLTVAVHDFEAIHRELELPPGVAILEALAEMDPEEARPKHERLAAIELELAREAEPMPGARDLLSWLRGAGCRLGILTRNNRLNCEETLAACGLADWFDADSILTRECAEPKPHPDGIHRLLDLWGAGPNDGVMVGDYLFDLEAGRAAGVATVYVDPTGAFEHGEHADHRFEGLEGLLATLRTGPPPSASP